jgi:hypothetical protein
MPFFSGKIIRIYSLRMVALAALGVFAALGAFAAQAGNAGSVRGSVTDPTGAVIPNAAVHPRPTQMASSRL